MTRDRIKRWNLVVYHLQHQNWSSLNQAHIPVSKLGFGSISSRRERPLEISFWQLQDLTKPTSGQRMDKQLVIFKTICNIERAANETDHFQPWTQWQWLTRLILWCWISAFWDSGAEGKWVIFYRKFQAGGKYSFNTNFCDTTLLRFRTLNLFLPLPSACLGEIVGDDGTDEHLESQLEGFDSSEFWVCKIYNAY